MGKANQEDTETKIQQALRNALQQYQSATGRNQQESAEDIGTSSPNLSKYLNGHLIPPVAVVAQLAALSKNDELYSLLTLEPSTSRIEQNNFQGIEWMTHLSPYMTLDQRTEIRDGITFFERLLGGESTSDILLDVAPLADVTWLFNAMKSALRSESFTITAVPRHKELEKMIKATFTHLKQVYVAKIPLFDPNKDVVKPGEEPPPGSYYMHGSLLRTELVAWLAAMEVLPQLSKIQRNGIGIDFGYTTLRCAELAVPNSDYFNGANWIPLPAINYAYSDTSAANQAASRVPSANYNARRFMNKYVNSLAYYRRYYHDEATMPRGQVKSSEAAEKPDYFEYRRQIASMTSVLLSVNSIGRSGTEQWRTSDYMPITNLVDIYHCLRKELQKPEFKKHYGEIAGEMLGVFYDERGTQIRMKGTDHPSRNPVGKDGKLLSGKARDTELKRVEQEDKANGVVHLDVPNSFFQLELDVIRDACRRASVWLISSRHYKSRAVLAALKNSAKKGENDPRDSSATRW